MNNSNKHALSCAVAATLGAVLPAEAAQYSGTLTQVSSYSNNGTSAGNITSSTATWVYDDATMLLTQSGGTFNVRFNIAPTTTLFRHSITGLVIGNGAAATASAYVCSEGSFGGIVGASLCGNYNFGGNAVNESASSWGPGTAVARTLVGDDMSVGAQQDVAQYNTFTQSSFTGTSLVLSNAACNVPSCTGTATPSGFNTGYRWTLTAAPLVPTAADDGPIAVVAGASAVIPVGANDTNFTNPTTISNVTVPTQGTITTFSPPGPTAGLTITYTANVGAVGADSFVYTLTDGSGGTDTGTVSLNISAVVLDNDPDPFAFTAQTDVQLNTQITSDAITVAGIDTPTAISVSAGGDYAINGGAFTAAPGTVNAGDTVTVRQTSSTNFDTPTTTTLTIGSVTGDFVVTTLSNIGDEVLVIDGGSSGVDPLSLGFLAGLPLLRRRRKAALKLAAAVATVAAAVSVLAGPTQAAEDDRWDWDYDGLYLGAGVNGTSLEGGVDRQGLVDALDIAGAQDSFEDFPVGGQAYAGWMFNRYWGLEGRWSGTDDGESKLYLQDPAGVKTKLGEATISLDGWTAYAVGNWPVAQRWDLFGKLGWTWQDAEVEFDPTDAFSGSSFSAETDDNGLAVVLGGRWRFARHWAATLEGEYFAIDFDEDLEGDPLDEPWRTSLNIEYWFGGAEIAPPPPPPAKVVAAPPPPPPAPKDSDGDGVVDGTDQCPETPRGDRVGPAGCSCDVSRQLQFAFDSAKLTDADKLILDEMAENLNRLKFVSGTIAGYTDSIGTDAYNKGLSERRAKTVADYLEAKGIAAGRLEVVGMGEADPIGDNKTDEGRAQNRRVVAKRTDCDK